MLALGGFVEAAGTSEQARLVTVAVAGEQVTSPRETTAGGLLRAAGGRGRNPPQRGKGREGYP